MAHSRRCEAVFGRIPRVRVKLYNRRGPETPADFRPDLSVKSVTGIWSRRKIFLEFAFHPLILLGFGRGFLLLRDVRQALGIFGIHLEPFFQSGLGVWLDGIGG